MLFLLGYQLSGCFHFFMRSVKSLTFKYSYLLLFFFQLWGSIITITFHRMSWAVKATQPCFKRTTKQSLNKITNKNICQTFPVIKSLPFSCCRMLSTGDSLLRLARNTALPKRRVRLRECRANLSFISVQLTMNDNPAIHLR